METVVKKFLKSITPPIILKGVKAVLSTPPKPAVTEKCGEKTAEWYDASFDNADHWKQHYSLSRYYFLWTVIADRISRNELDSILEIGCGPGQLACLLRDKGIQHYHGFDFSPNRINHARKMCPQFTFFREDAFRTDLFTNSDYRVVICTEFLEHVENDTDILKRIKSGKKFFGTVPNFPYISHVRHFESGKDVYTRYKSFFSELKVDSFPANNRGKTFFLMEGTTL